MKPFHMTIARYSLFFINLFLINSSFSANDIVIQPDYWTGSQCVENGVPYQTPDSIYKEAEYCTNDDVVLELGTGGSTIFFAKRCKHVIAIETDASWAKWLQMKIEQLNLNNITLLTLTTQKEIEKFLREIDKDQINIFSVDTVHGYNRSAFVSVFLENGISPQLRMMVLDNYADPTLFPFHFDKEIVNTCDWDIFRYDGIRWCGNGTKLYIKKN